MENSMQLIYSVPSLVGSNVAYQRRRESSMLGILFVLNMKR